ncbi:hypothetical protein, partial [Ralstonia pseudosolanacearum]|uniref:hypothetical protein n=1 Tax=Ralstonia pseudosolanacearum TaxID=1310165 RepID=UPI001E52DB41
ALACSTAWPRSLALSPSASPEFQLTGVAPPSNSIYATTPVVPHAVTSALKPDEPIRVIDKLGNGPLPDSHAIVRPGQNEARTAIEGGKIDPEALLNHEVLRRWWPRRG